MYVILCMQYVHVVNGAEDSIKYHNNITENYDLSRQVSG